MIVKHTFRIHTYKQVYSTWEGVVGAEHTQPHKYMHQTHTVQLDDTKKAQIHIHTSAAGLDNRRKI